MSKEDNSAMRRGRLIWIIALCGLLSGCFLFPTAVKRETLLLPRHRIRRNGRDL